MMSGFIRVRSAVGPLHEYDAPTGEVEANPDLYVVVDDTVVSQPREPLYVLPTTKKASAPEPSVGDKNEEGA
jgi:hypothetical protein